MLLQGKPVVSYLDDETREYIIKDALDHAYVAIFLLSSDKASEVYVSMKSKKAKNLGLYADIFFGKDWSIEEVLEEIERVNNDRKCVGVMIQLPLTKHLKVHQMRLVDAIVPEKDIDGLGSLSFGKSAFGVNNFLGATPKASLEILKYYKMDDFTGKIVTIIGRSNLIGKPLAIELIKRGATVIICNSMTNSSFLKQSLACSHYIFSATGKKHLICENILNKEICRRYKNYIPLHQKILIDIGRGSDDEGAYGDIDWKYFKNKVKGITPVPGGVGPVTVSCLFHNIIYVS